MEVMEPTRLYQNMPYLLGGFIYLNTMELCFHTSTKFILLIKSKVSISTTTVNC